MASAMKNVDLWSKRHEFSPQSRSSPLLKLMLTRFAGAGTAARNPLLVFMTVYKTHLLSPNLLVPISGVNHEAIWTWDGMA